MSNALFRKRTRIPAALKCFKLCAHLRAISCALKLVIKNKLLVQFLIYKQTQNTRNLKSHSVEVLLQL